MIPTITHPDPIAPLRALTRCTESMTRVADAITAPARAMHHIAAITRPPVVIPRMLPEVLA
jgi:hypothetical protein